MISELYKQRFTTANENLQSLYTLYVQWYTFFWTLNGAALAWLYGSSGTAALTARPKQQVLAAIFIFLNALAIGTCCYCWRMAHKLRSDASAAMKSWTTEVRGSEKHTISQDAGLFTEGFARFVFASGCMSLCADIVAWSVLAFIR